MISMTAAAFFIFMLSGNFSSIPFASEIPTNPRAEKIMDSIRVHLQEQLADRNLNIGSPVFIRIFKEPAVLELWMMSDNGQFTLFKDYEICSFSGLPGPKLQEGDLQSPEGFYSVTSTSFNPNSKFYLSINMGYPNSFDRYYKRTGSAIMIHGSCVSLGCYAMTDENIGEIYTLAAAAIKEGQSSINVHAFPFILKPEKLEKYKKLCWYSFWSNLKEGFDYFEEHRIPPRVALKNGRYEIISNGQVKK